MIEGLQGWPAAVAMLVAAVLFGFKFYWQAKKDVRSDTGESSVAEGYRKLLKDQATELERLTKKALECDGCYDELRTLKSRVQELTAEKQVLEATIRAQLDPNQRRVE